VNNPFKEYILRGYVSNKEEVNSKPGQIIIMKESFSMQGFVEHI